MKSIALGVCGLLAAAVSTAASAASAQPTVLKLEQFRRGIAMRVMVGGKERLFQFDTGGGNSFIAPEVSKDLNCEKGARVVGFQMTGEKLHSPRCDDVPLKIGGHDFTIPTAGVYQVGQFNAKGVTVDGLLALDVFDGRTITIDPAGLQVIVETPQSAAARIRGATEMPVRLVREAGGYSVTVDIQVPSKVGHLGFEIDTGNGGTILVGKPYSALFGFDPDKGPRMGSVPIGKGIVASGFVMPAGITLDGNLGMPFLKNHFITIDLAKGRLWLKPNPTTPPAGMGVPPDAPRP